MALSVSSREVRRGQEKLCHFQVQRFGAVSCLTTTLHLVNAGFLLHIYQHTCTDLYFPHTGARGSASGSRKRHGLAMVLKSDATMHWRMRKGKRVDDWLLMQISID